MHSIISESRLRDVSKLFLLLLLMIHTLRRLEDTSGWLLTDNAASWQGTPSDRGWRYLQQSLKRYDGQSNNYQYAKACLDTILNASRSLSPPLWLIDILEVSFQIYRYKKIKIK